ncbi:hypothetical protein [Streptomyces bluensis]|uniref:hypothetical protein n=1 Tax=Streptomyces bluensis TaxID=33897 RepID=UPI00331AB216
MPDLIARVLHTLCAWLFPATGTHRAVTPPSPTAPTPKPHRRPLPPHKSPYAVAAATHRPTVETSSPARPYLDAPRKQRTSKQQAQAERWWILDMATRGIDVGPTMIHGVHVGAGSRTIPVKVAV